MSRVTIRKRSKFIDLNSVRQSLQTESIQIRINLWNWFSDHNDLISLNIQLASQFIAKVMLFVMYFKWWVISSVSQDLKNIRSTHRFSARDEWRHAESCAEKLNFTDTAQKLDLGSNYHGQQMSAICFQISLIVLFCEMPTAYTTYFPVELVCTITLIPISISFLIFHLVETYEDELRYHYIHFHNIHTLNTSVYLYICLLYTSDAADE